MGDFTELPVQTGVGDYHINRFRIAFAPPPSGSAAALASDLIDNCSAISDDPGPDAPTTRDHAAPARSLVPPRPSSAAGIAATPPP